MRYEIKAPTEGANCTVAGVVFRDSRAETDDQNAVNYFRRHGYEVVDTAPGTDPEPEPAVDIDALRAERDKARAELAALKAPPEQEPAPDAVPPKPTPAKATKAAAKASAEPQ